MYIFVYPKKKKKNYISVVNMGVEVVYNSVMNVGVEVVL
jgi:hypothetical protein